MQTVELVSVLLMSQFAINRIESQNLATLAFIEAQ